MLLVHYLNVTVTEQSVILSNISKWCSLKRGRILCLIERPPVPNRPRCPVRLLSEPVTWPRSICTVRGLSGTLEKRTISRPTVARSWGIRPFLFRICVSKCCCFSPFPWCALQCCSPQLYNQLLRHWCTRWCRWARNKVVLCRERRTSPMRAITCGDDVGSAVRSCQYFDTLRDLSSHLSARENGSAHSWAGSVCTIKEVCGYFLEFDTETTQPRSYSKIIR